MLPGNRGPNLVSMDTLDRIDRNDSDDGGPGFTRLFDDGRYRRLADERPHRVMNGHKRRIRRELRERILHGFLPRIAAFHEPDRRQELLRVENLAPPREIFFA